MFESLKATRKTGAEQFTQGETALGFTVRDFWQWSSSDLVGNALRGQVAEYLVARALGVDGDVRSEWQAFDVAAPSGLRIEVKSSAYMQSWAQREESAISFGIRETLAWNAESNAFSPESERKRQADLYVFAVLAHRTKATLNPLDILQWEFYLLPAAALNQHVRKQRRISLSRLLAMNALRCSYAALRQTIGDVEREIVLARLQACDLIIDCPDDAEGFLLTFVQRDGPAQIVARGSFPPGPHPLGGVIQDSGRHGDWEVIEGPPRRFRPLPDANVAFYIEHLRVVESGHAPAMPHAGAK